MFMDLEEELRARKEALERGVEEVSAHEIPEEQAEHLRKIPSPHMDAIFACSSCSDSWPLSVGK